MFEFIAPLVVGGLGLIPAVRRKDERAMIEQTFKNIKFGLKQGNNMKYPFFLKKHENDVARRYDYKLPLGLVIREDMSETLSKTLGKPVEVDGENVMSIWIFKQKLPTKWSYNEVPNKEGWVIPIGMSHKGLVWHDFDEIPHMIVGGATRFGKTVFLKVLMTYLTEQHGDDCEFYIVDLKGGLAFHRYSNLKQVKTVAGDFKTAKNTMETIEKDIQTDMENFKSQYYENITDTPIQKRKFVIIDEAGELANNGNFSDSQKDYAKTCRRVMSNIARVSGGLGYRMIWCSQYPTADILDRQIKANSSAKLAFKMETGTMSKVVIDETGAEKIPNKGRAIYKTVEKEMVQVPLLENNDMWERLRRFERDDDVETSTENVEGRKNYIHFR